MCRASSPNPTTSLSISDNVRLFWFRQSCIEFDGCPPSCFILVNLSSLMANKLESSSNIATEASWPNADGAKVDVPKIFIN